MWAKLRDAGILVLGAGMAIGLLGLNDETDELEKALKQAAQEVVENRIVDCRILVSQEIELIPDGPCMEPRIMKVLCTTPPMPKECNEQP